MMASNQSFARAVSNNDMREDMPEDTADEASKAKKANGAFRTISEVAEELDVQQHVLRFWETRFSQIRPLKRGGGRRYYRPEDLALLKKIHHLLYTEGYTIKGVQKLLKGQSKSQILMDNSPETATAARPDSSSSSLSAQRKTISAPANSSVQDSQKSKVGLTPTQRNQLEMMLNELKAARDLLRA